MGKMNKCVNIVLLVNFSAGTLYDHHALMNKIT